MPAPDQTPKKPDPTDDTQWEELDGEFDEAWLTPEGWKDFGDDNKDK